MPQALSGKRRSTPKVCRILADDDRMIVYRKAGNNHAQPFLWADMFTTMTSGITSIVVASGIVFHGYTLADDGNVTASPMSDPENRWWIVKDTTDNRILIHRATDNRNDYSVDFDVQFMLGVDADIEEIFCRGNRGAMPSYP